MKKLLIAIISVAACAGAYAQDKGNLSVGGALGLSGGYTLNSGTSTMSSPLTFNLNPVASYFVIDNLEVSSGLDYSLAWFSEKENNTIAAVTTNIAQFQAGLHYYIPVLKDLLFYTPGINLGFGGGSILTKAGDVKETAKIPFAFSLLANLGKFEIQPHINWGITVNVLDFRFDLLQTKSGEEKINAMNLSYGLNYGASVGIKYYF